MIAPLLPAGETEASVSGIKAVKGARGGRLVEDHFDVQSSDVVEAIVKPYNRGGSGAMVFRDQEQMAVMLVPPLGFTFKTKRSDDVNARRWPTELFVTGHFICFVHRPRKAPRWAFDTDRAAYSEEHKTAFKIMLATAVSDASESVRDRIPPKLHRALRAARKVAKSMLEGDSSEE